MTFRVLLISPAGAGLHEPAGVNKDRPLLRQVLSSGSAQVVDVEGLQVSRLLHDYLSHGERQRDVCFTYLQLQANDNRKHVTRPPSHPGSVLSSQLRLFSLNRVRIALRGASVANRRLRDPEHTVPSESITTSGYVRLEEWCIEMLVAQIDGGDPAVARAALSVLEEATQDERCLRTLVGCMPPYPRRCQ